MKFQFNKIFWHFWIDIPIQKSILTKTNILFCFIQIRFALPHDWMVITFVSFSEIYLLCKQDNLHSKNNVQLLMLE